MMMRGPDRGKSPNPPDVPAPQPPVRQGGEGGGRAGGPGGPSASTGCSSNGNGNRKHELLGAVQTQTRPRRASSACSHSAPATPSGSFEGGYLKLTSLTSLGLFEKPKETSSGEAAAAGSRFGWPPSSQPGATSTSTSASTSTGGRHRKSGSASSSSLYTARKNEKAAARACFPRPTPSASTRRTRRGKTPPRSPNGPPPPPPPSASHRQTQSVQLGSKGWIPGRRHVVIQEYPFGPKSRTPANILTGPEIHMNYFSPSSNRARRSQARAAHHRSRRVYSLDRSQIRALRDRSSRNFALYAERLEHTVRQYRRMCDERKKQRYKEISDTVKELELRRRYMQHEVVSVMQKRDHIRESLYEVEIALYRRQTNALTSHLEKCGRVLEGLVKSSGVQPGLDSSRSSSKDASVPRIESKASRDSHEAQCPEVLMRAVEDLLDGEAEVKALVTRQSSISSELRKVSSELAALLKRDEKMNAVPRSQRAKMILQDMERYYRNGGQATPLYVPAPEEEFKFDCLLSDERHPEGKAVSKWIKLLEGKDTKSIPQGRIQVFILQFAKGFIDEHGIPEDQHEYLHILFERIIVRKLLHTISFGEAKEQERKIKRNVLWMKKLTQSQMGIPAHVCAPEEKAQNSTLQAGWPGNLGSQTSYSENRVEDQPYGQAIKILEEAGSLVAPTDIGQAVLHCAQAIYRLSRRYASMRSDQKKEPEIGADSFFPILLFVVSHSNSPGLSRSAHIVRLFSRRSDESSERMYYITALEGALHYVANANQQDFHNGRSPFTTPATSEASSSIVRNEDGQYHSHISSLSRPPCSLTPLNGNITLLQNNLGSIEDPKRNNTN